MLLWRLVQDVVVVVSIRSKFPDLLETVTVNRAYIHASEIYIRIRLVYLSDPSPESKFHSFSGLFGKRKDNNSVLLNVLDRDPPVIAFGAGCLFPASLIAQVVEST